MIRYLPAALCAASMAVVILFLRTGNAAFEWGIPLNYPTPAVPPDNPMDSRKVALGRRLFYDTRLSLNGTTACATCHVQALAFTDGRTRSVGATGELHPRSAMSLVNSAYASRLNWANHLIDKLEDQALTPIFGDDPVEMGMAGHEEDIVALLRSEPFYRANLQLAFPADSDPASVLNAVRAIAVFVRSIVSFDAPYDRFLRGDASAMSASAQRGMELFFSERLECFHCHGGFNFTDSSTHESATVESIGYHNNGLYNIGGEGGYPPDNTGLHDMTGLPSDMGRFKAPSLRNVAITAPYMHDGSAATLDDVIDHYARGGRQVTDGPYAGDGRHNPYKSTFVKGFEISETERGDLIEFLESLTDRRVLTDERWSNPW